MFYIADIAKLDFVNVLYLGVPRKYSLRFKIMYILEFSLIKKIRKILTINTLFFVFNYFL